LRRNINFYKMKLHYPGCGLKNVWLNNGYQSLQTKYGPAYSYMDIDGLYRAIALKLCTSNLKMEPDVIRFLRKRLNLSQDELGQKLGYTSQAVAKWEKGISKIPVPASKLIRLWILEKFDPKMTLHAAFEEINFSTTERLIFEYTNSIWQYINEDLAVRSFYIKDLTGNFEECYGNHHVRVFRLGTTIKNPVIKETRTASLSSKYEAHL